MATPNDDIIRANPPLKKVKPNTTMIYKIFNDEEFHIFHTKQNPNRFLSGKHQTNETIKRIVVSDYFILLLDTLTDKTNDFIQNKCEILKFEEHKKKQIASDLKYGKIQEHIVLEHINRFFSNDIIKMCVGQFSTCDFLGLLTQFVYELKSNYDKYEDYPTAIIGIEKVVAYEKQIFLFQFKTDTGANELYFFIKPEHFKTTYKKRQIYLQKRDKYNWVYDIPRSELRKINSNDTMELPTCDIQNELFMRTLSGLGIG